MCCAGPTELQTDRKAMCKLCHIVTVAVIVADMERQLLKLPQNVILWLAVFQNAMPHVAAWGGGAAQLRQFCQRLRQRRRKMTPVAVWPWRADMRPGFQVQGLQVCIVRR